MTNASRHNAAASRARLTDDPPMSPPTPTTPLRELSASSAVADVSTDGAFARKASTFRASFGDGPNDGAHPPVGNRYELVVSLACPWACRALATMALRGLDDAIAVRVTHPVWARTRPGDEADTHSGWVFVDDASRAQPSPSGRGAFVATNSDACGPEGVASVRELYEMVNAPKEQRFTVPVVWDTVTKTIVNNESSEIIRELNDPKWNAVAKNPEVDLYPAELREEIDAVNAWVYEKINNGVYKCGFAVSQSAYDEAVDALFDALDECERILSRRRYIAGNVLTEADVRLFQTLIRFDEVYVVYFKTNKKFIHQYEHLSGYVRELYQMDALRASVDMNHIKYHYFASHPSLNVHAIVPAGPNVDLFAPHGRDGAYPR